MKKLLLGILGILTAAIGALVWSFQAKPLPAGPAFDAEIPEADPPEEMRVSVLEAGRLFNSAAFAYRGGSFEDERVFGMDAILVEHPEGRLLFDTGFGRDVDVHFQSNPWLMRVTSRYEPDTPVIEQLEARGLGPADLRAIVLTHAHWDHVSGLPDFPGVPVWVTSAERDFIEAGGPAVALAQGFRDINWYSYDFPDGKYFGFERSYDVFDDGSVVVVPARGHTPGSIIAFIQLPDGRRFALIGDTAWQSEGVSIPAERPWLPRTMVDVDPAAVRKLLVHMHALERDVPNLRIVPAHDRRATASLPRFSTSSSSP